MRNLAEEEESRKRDRPKHVPDNLFTAPPFRKEDPKGRVRTVPRMYGSRSPAFKPKSDAIMPLNW
jgi:hypothetical protein